MTDEGNMNDPRDIADRVVSPWGRETVAIPADDLNALRSRIAKAIEHERAVRDPSAIAPFVRVLEVAQVNLGPGDRLVINLREHVTDEQLEGLAKVFSRMEWKGEKPLIFACPAGIDLAKISTEST